MKIYYIPFTNAAIAKFRQGKLFRFRINRFPKVILITIGRFQFWSNWEVVNEYYKEAVKKGIA